ncbi:hypothetical protein QNK01_03170 [Desemzia incerta]|uniref:hypothetical protein n=1 Tax=Desemzia incerta TaxID=82801 RepID=UPI0024C4124E|nr:hypothetical protein [Desemzia incerta]WHZ32631.1 hypothetical protein QNK01_03170 [Desemzia incerta]
MRDIILILSEIMNQIHDILMVRVGINMTDKQLHFWVIGFIGLATFLIVFVLVKLIQLLKFHTTILSFIFTFIMMTVFVFAIEIQQAITNSGNMEFADAIAGLWGFIVFFAIYTVIAGILYGMFRLVRGKKTGRKPPKQNKKSSTPIVEKNPAYYKAEIRPESNGGTADEQNEKPIRTRTEARKQKESIRQK